jgi:hypothetical protein
LLLGRHADLHTDTDCVSDYQVYDSVVIGVAVQPSAGQGAAPAVKMLIHR